MDFNSRFWIPEPCHEDWGKMTPEAQGRFCAACKRCVVDLTGKSTHEIGALLDASNGDMCGRIGDAEMAPPQPEAVPARTVSRLLRGPLRAVQVFAVALLLVMGVWGTAKAQNSPEHQYPIMGKIAYVPPAKAHKGQVSGFVKGSDGRGIEGAEVSLIDREGTLRKTLSGPNGAYKFEELPLVEYKMKATYKKSMGTTLFELKEGKPALRRDLRIEWAAVVPTEEVEEVPTTELGEEPLDASGAEKELQLGDASEVTAGGYTLRIYPSPSPDVVTVELQGSADVQISYALLDLQGKTIQSGEWLAAVAMRQVLNLEGLADGTYLLRIRCGSEVVERKLIKQK